MLGLRGLLTRALAPSRSVRRSSTRKSKAVLLQDVDQVPVYRVSTSGPSDRRVYVWGLSETGALGTHKSLKTQSQKQAAFIQHPTRLQFAERHEVLDVAAGYGFTAFAVRNTDGISLFGCGINTDSQLGYQHRDGRPDATLELVIYPAPIQLPVAADGQSPVQVQRCSAGRAHLLALDSGGRVYTLGNNAYGQCGRPIVAGEAYAGSGTVHVLDGVEGRRIADVQCGQDHSLLLTECGRVYACGWGADGQTGLGHYGSTAQPTWVRGAIDGERIVRLAGSVDCVLALNGEWVWGGQKPLANGVCMHGRQGRSVRLGQFRVQSAGGGRRRAAGQRAAGAPIAARPRQDRRHCRRWFHVHGAER